MRPTAEQIARRRAWLESQSARIRRIFDITPDSDATERAQHKRLARSFQVMGRWAGLRRVWDVFELDGKARPRLVCDGLPFEAEALARASDLCMGRVSVAMPGLRGVFARAGSGVAVTGGGVDAPGDAFRASQKGSTAWGGAKVRTDRQADGSVIVSPR